MKKTILLLAASLVLFGISSCGKTKDKIDQLTEFDIPYSSNATIPASTFNTTVAASAPFDVKSPDIPTNSSSNFANNKTSSDLISEIKMTKLDISVPSGNLDFIRSASIFMNATGLAEVKIASNLNFPTGQTMVSLEMTGANIIDYIKKDNISFRVAGTVQTSTTQIAQSLKMDAVVHVKATLLK